MFLSLPDQASQLDRLLRRLPTSYVQDVARPWEDRVWDAIVATGGITAQRWSKVEANAPVLADLRGFALWSSLEVKEGGLIVIGSVYLVDRAKKLWHLVISKAAHILDVLKVRPATAAEVVEAADDPVRGPWPWCHSLMLHQFGPAAKSARERSARLEHLVEFVEHFSRLDEETWQSHELVVAWRGEPASPMVIRDVTQPSDSRKYLAREWTVGSEPHLIASFDSLKDALAKANDQPGCLRRKPSRMAPSASHGAPVLSPVTCERCNAERAEYFAHFEGDGWKYSGACGDGSALYEIPIAEYFESPEELVDWMAQLHEKTWFQARDFFAMMERLRGALGGEGA